MNVAAGFDASLNRESGRRPRVLYVQRPLGGGSAASLYEMVRAVLALGRFEPIVLFHQANRYCHEVRRLGVRVVLLRPSDGSSSSISVGRGRASCDRGQLRGLGKARRLIQEEWPTVRAIMRILRRESVDLVHHNNHTTRDRASILAASLARVPQVCHVRFLSSYRWVDRLLARRVDFFLYGSIAIERHCRDQVRIPATVGKVVYNAFDFDRYSCPTGCIERVRDKLGLDGGPVVVNIGRLVPWKGQDVFLRAVAEVVRVHRDIRVLIVGESASQPQGRIYAQELLRLAESLGISDRVTFTGFCADIPEIMAAADVVVHSAVKPEPFGRVVVEALAAARPVVATAAGGVPEIVDHRETGLLVDRGNPRSMANAILELLANPGRAKEMAQLGKTRVEARFGSQRLGRTLNELYERVLDGRLHAHETAWALDST